MATQALQQRIDIGTVISLGFRTLGRNFLPFLAFALLLVGLPAFLVSFFVMGDAADAIDLPFLSPYYWLTVAVSWITGTLLQGIIVRAALRDLGGRRPDLGESVTTALKLLLPMIGLSIVSGIAIMLGFMLLIVPGVILMLMWSIAVPVLIEERRGVFGSLGRSHELTRGSKGWIFLLMLLYWGVTWLIGGVVALGFGIEAVMGDSATVMPLVAMAVAQTISSLLLAAMLAALYVELRQVREGAAPDQLAAIFE